MSSHCLKCRQNTERENPKVVGAKRKNNAFIKMCGVSYERARS